MEPFLPTPQLRVVAFESRRAKDMEKMIEQTGGIAYVSPSMREVPTPDHQPAINFSNRILVGEIDAVIFTTGVGIKTLLEHIDRHIDQQRFLDTLSDITTIARGPKPAAVLRKLGVTPTLEVSEPNTWREILTTLDAQFPVTNLTIGLQEYGIPNTSLIAGLEARGATVETVQVYQWEFPEDTTLFEANIHRLLAREADVVLFTSANQAVHLLQLADRLNLKEELLAALQQLVVISIGPTTSELLRQKKIPVDREPSRPKMGHLVQEALAQAPQILAHKRQLQTPWVKTSNISSHHQDMTQRDPSMTTETSSPKNLAPWYNSEFMKACRLEKTSFTPVWLMRQAGRYMSEYREVRAKMTFLELCKNPQLCSEVMCTAVDVLGVDAAIIFSDILPILEPMGLELEFQKGDGPKIHNPIRSAKDVSRLLELQDMDRLGFVTETVTQTRKDLPETMPLIGFSGAPFTLASYAIEGGSSRNYLNTKKLMYTEPSAWDAMMQRFARAITLYLNAQIEAGAQVVQLFDSWAGSLSSDDYRQYALPYIKQILAGLTPGVPVINFGAGNPELLPMLAETGAAVIGVDWRIRLDKAWEAVGHDRAVQGNLDPLVLLSNKETILQKTNDLLKQAAGRPGHIFNLGHGILKETPVENAKYLIQLVHELSAR